MTKYLNNSWNTTKNNALFHLYLDQSVMFKVDDQSYGCEFYKYDATFSDRKQVEELFDKQFDMISPYDIVELCEIMKGSTHDKLQSSEENEGSFNFTNLKIPSDILRLMMDGEIANAI